MEDADVDERPVEAPVWARSELRGQRFRFVAARGSQKSLSPVCQKLVERAKALRVATAATQKLKWPVFNEDAVGKS